MRCHRLPVLSLCFALSACAAVATDSAALPRYHWQLSDAVDSGNHRMDALLDRAQKPLQIDFSANALSVSNACNGIHGRYTVVKNHLVVELMMQTMMACAQPALMQRETVLKQVLRGEPAIALSRQDGHVQLTLGTPGGQSLTFTGVPVDDNH
jgi:heat shock protein HslJ